MKIAQQEVMMEQLLPQVVLQITPLMEVLLGKLVDISQDWLLEPIRLSEWIAIAVKQIPTR